MSEQKVALITGGASGLGAATARAIAQAGGKILILDLNEELGKNLETELGSARFVKAAVTDSDQVQNAIDIAVKELGGLHITVNCAGIGSACRTVDKDGRPFDLAAFRRTLEVNLVGSFNAIRLAASQMIGNDADEGGERGVVVNTASVAAFEGQIGQAAYSASKGGIVGMTLPIARDLARHGIRVCTIAPGLFDTPLLRSLPEEARNALGASVPFPPRLGQPSEYALLACQVVENPMLNGATIRLDGAIRMAPK